LNHKVEEVAVSLSNTVLIDMSAAAAAMGDVTATYTAASTLAAPGLAVGFAAAVSFAQGTGQGTSAETTSLVPGGVIMSGHTVHLSIDFPYGPTPTSADVSITVVSSHGTGDTLGGYALPEYSGPSLHGLF
jgi:hypothetical protein